MTSFIQVFCGLAGFRLLVAGFSSRAGTSQIRPAARAVLRRGRALIGLTAPDELSAAALVLRGDAGSAEEMLNSQLLLGVLAICASGYLLCHSGLLMLPLAAAGVVGGMQAPVIVLRARLDSARHAALRDAPRAIELLAVHLASGMSGEQATRLAREGGTPSWRPLWTRAAVELSLGNPPPVALGRVVSDAGLVRLLPVVSSWRRSAQLGLPVAEQLFAAAAGLRAAENAAALRRAGRVGPVATLVIAMVIAPAAVAFLATLLVAGVAGQGLVR